MIDFRVALVLWGVALGSIGCAGGSRLSRHDLNRVSRPAFVGRIEEHAGPKAEVFRADRTYKDRLRRLEPKEGDRRLQAKLARGMSRWEVAERLRATTLSKLPKDEPWTRAVDPVAVARAFQSYLVEEVPVNEPDYRLLKPMGADSVLEFVIREYGMRSKDGKAAAYVRGYARLFKLKGGGGTLWSRSFSADGANQERGLLDPFDVAKEPMRYKDAMNALVDGVAELLARDLTPAVEEGRPPPRTEGNESGESAPAVDQLESTEPDPL